MTVCAVSEVSGMISIWYHMAGYRFLATGCTCQIMLQHVGDGLCKPGHEIVQASMVKPKSPSTFLSTPDVISPSRKQW